MADTKNNPPAEAAADAAATESTEHLVRRWLAENLSGGSIARNVDNWNELQAAIPALISIIEGSR